MNFNVGFATDIGRKRAQNQDSGCSFPDLELFVVADGMGGHRGGETASAMAVEIIPEIVREQRRNPAFDPADVISHAIAGASNRIYDRSSKEPQLQGMGTTAVALLFKGEQLVIGHVGDSRCYFIRQHAIWQATRDHSLVQEKLRAGLITRAAVKSDRMKNVITRSVGFEGEVDVETYGITVQAGDLLLLCSDGLSGLVEDSQMLEIIQKNLFEGKSPEADIQKTVRALIDAANANGGDDNITAILVQVQATGAHG